MVKAIAKRLLSWEARLRLRRWYYRGRSFFCPVCGSSVRKLYPNGLAFPVLEQLEIVGGEFRDADTCPVCWAHCRTRLVHHYLLAELRLEERRDPLRVLHFAPENGLSLAFGRMANVAYEPADLCPEIYGHLSRITRADVTAIPFADDLFDLVLCNHVLEHIPDDLAAMKELHRVTRPGGIALLQVPLSPRLEATIEDPDVSDPAERERRFGQADHVRVYGRDYVRRLKRSGFAVEVFDPVEGWGAAAVERLRLNPREKVFVARKPAEQVATAEQAIPAAAELAVVLSWANGEAVRH